jgi:hypothetical protein
LPVDDLVHDAQVRLIDKAERHQGLTPPPDVWRQPGIWLKKALVRQVVDAARREFGQRGPRYVEEVVEVTGPEARIDAGRTLVRVGEILREPSMPGTWALAFGCFHLPEYVDVALVQRAAASSAWEAGLYRPAAETWTEIRQWADRWGPGTPTRDARWELVWILRSSREVDARTWQADDPEGARRAFDVVRKWSERGFARVQDVIRAEMVGAASTHPV